MRELASAVYWVLVGGLIGYGCCFGLFGLPFLATGLLLGIVGLVTLETRGAWAITVGFGGAPAYVILMMALEARDLSSPPPCNQIEPREGVVVFCSPSILDYIPLGVLFGVIALSGPAGRVLVLMRGRTSRRSHTSRHFSE